MTFQQAINELTSGNRSDEAVKVVAQVVASNSQRGQWYSGPSSTNVADWVAEGEYTGTETAEALAAEWDR